jgi:hypothetical protein
MRVYDGSAWIDSGSGLTFAEISATPTTLAGYGITDAVASSSVSVYGASLIDDADAATARTTLGLGTAATTAASAYATAAQGTTADSVSTTIRLNSKRRQYDNRYAFRRHLLKRNLNNGYNNCN